ncbi:hypothetical protein, partial [Mycobacterium lacus]|uniref:hypothetical protein n=1 Tax=Mycobacterium lacus TaxID=169765 RepID=UPI00146EF11E
ATGTLLAVDAGGELGVFDGASTGPCLAADSIPAAMASGAGADPDWIALIAPSDSDCAPAAAGCPDAIPVANDCPIDPGDTPRPTAAGDNDGAPGIPGAAGTPGPTTGGPPPAGVATGGADGTGPALALQLEPPGTCCGDCEPTAWTSLPTKLPPPTICGGATSSVP